LTINGKGDTKRTPKKKEGKKQRSKGIVYLMRTQLRNGDVVIKIGVTGRLNVQERFMENLSAFFMCHRYVPYTTLLKFSKTKDYYKAETMLHQMYKADRYFFEKEFQGMSEYFVVDDEEALVEAYVKIMKECQEKPEKVVTVDADAIEPGEL